MSDIDLVFVAGYVIGLIVMLKVSKVARLILFETILHPFTESIIIIDGDDTYVERG